MKAINDFENVKESGNGNFAKLPAGGYICGIYGCTDVSAKEYLKLDLDIVDGEFRGFGHKQKEEAGFNSLETIKSYKDSCVRFFKAFITAVEKSNPNYKWNWDEKTLVKKVVGVVIGEEEYLNKNGEVKIKVKPQFFCSVEDIKNGKFKVPELKKLKEDQRPKQEAKPDDSDFFTESGGDDDIPF